MAIACDHEMPSQGLRRSGCPSGAIRCENPDDTRSILVNETVENSRTLEMIMNSLAASTPTWLILAITPHKARARDSSGAPRIGGSHLDCLFGKPLTV